jgi:hypothetical protein
MLNRNTTIKVTRKILESLHRLAGELAKKLGKRVTLEDAIVYLLKKNESIEVKSSSFLSEVEKDRKIFLMILERKFSEGNLRISRNMIIMI